MTDAERDIFDKTKEILNLIGGRPPNVKEILISETMRIEDSGYSEAVGLWEEFNQRIIIKRDQLSSLQDYAGTLLHELAHARSGAGDVTGKFEDELTKLLGIVTEQAIRNKLRLYSGHEVKLRK